MLGHEINIPGVEQLQYPHHRVNRNPLQRNLAQAAIVKTLSPFRLIEVPSTPESAFRNAHHRQRLRLAQPQCPHPFSYLIELHWPYLLQPLSPSHPNLLP